MQSDLLRVLEKELATEDADDADEMTLSLFFCWIVFGAAFVWFVTGLSFVTVLGVLSISACSFLFGSSLTEWVVWTELEEMEEEEEFEGIETEAKQAYARGEITREEMEDRVDYAVEDREEDLVLE